MKSIYRIFIASPPSKDRKQLEAYFVSQPYELVLASGLAEASQLMGNGGIDIFILDIATAEIDVFEITKKIKSDPQTRLAPVIIVCPAEDEKSRARGIDAGCDDFLSKPYDRIEVQTRVDTILKLAHARSALEGQAKFDSLFDYMEDGIILLDDNLKITRLNEKARELLKYGEPKGPVYFPECVQKAYKIYYQNDLDRSMKKEPLRFDIERPETETLRPLILEVRSNVIRSAFRDISGVIVTLDDVTEIRDKAFKEEQFLNFISHKLQTPLAIVNKNAALFHKNVLGPLTDDQKVFMTAIFEKSSELVESFEKLIQFMAAKNRKADLFNEPIALEPALGERLDALVKREKIKKVDLKVNVENNNIKVSYDKKHFEIILQNLIENAVKFGDKDTVKITGNAKKIGEFAEITIQDNGPGIPPEERENIFKPFYQIDKNRTGNIRGTGLGLAIVQYLVTAHGGEIKISSDLGKQTAFSFTLPLAQ